MAGNPGFLKQGEPGLDEIQHRAISKREATRDMGPACRIGQDFSHAFEMTEDMFEMTLDTFAMTPDTFAMTPDTFVMTLCAFAVTLYAFAMAMGAFDMTSDT
ncbi:MAG: hypothetical protein WCX84_08655 [Syntrophales bacterium]|nr:hypothetical protein [Syntrophales bacterium]